MIDIENRRLYELDDVSSAMAATLPPRIRDAIDNFVWFGTPPGSFVRAVLANDLMDAARRADSASIAVLGLICGYVYNAVPRICHGSREAVDAHIERGRKAREEAESDELRSS